MDPLDDMMETEATSYRKGMFQDMRTPTQMRQDREKKLVGARPR